jgi:hypothetical protein
MSNDGVNARPPGFNIVEPGFRIFDDGSVSTYGSDLGRPFFKNFEEAAAWVNELVNGAYSVFPGVYNAGHAVARGTGVLDAEEFRRFGQEADAFGVGLHEAVRHPEVAYRVARRAVNEAGAAIRDNPRLVPYLTGRAAMGFGTGLGPAAAMGDVLRAVENGHNWADGIVYGILGIPPKDRR